MHVFAEAFMVGCAVSLGALVALLAVAFVFGAADKAVKLWKGRHRG